MDLSQYKLIWSDEFNHFDSSKWMKASPQTWPDRYGTIKAWDPSLVSVANGHLQLAVDQRPDGWYGGLVHGRNLEAWKYGYIEFRAELPAGQGLWSALWMMPRDNVYGYWPKSGEIDVLEYLGTARELTHGYSTVHYSANGNHAQKYVVANGVDWSQDWHTWGVQWDQGSDGHVALTFYVDGKPFGTISDTQYARAVGGGQGSPFDQLFYPILNLTVGGAWAGEPTSAVDGAKLLVDWVRAYQPGDDSSSGIGTSGTGTSGTGTSGTGTSGTGSNGTGSNGTGSNGTNRIVATSASELIKGTQGADEIAGMAGNDTIEAGGGNDTIFAGPGNDFIFGGPGADVVMIEPRQGQDKFYDYQDGIDKIGISGGLRIEDFRLRYDSTWKYTWVTDKDGNALLGLKNVVPSQIDASDYSGVSASGTGGGGSVGGATGGTGGTPSPTAGVTRVDGTDRAEILRGTGGNDVFRGLGGNDTIYGNSGNDTMSGGPGDDFFFGQAGVDVLMIERSQGADKFYDFQDGIDKVGLAGGLRFADLRFSHDPAWNYTWIHDPLGTKLLGLKGVVPTQVTALDFTTLDSDLF